MFQSWLTPKHSHCFAPIPTLITCAHCFLSNRVQIHTLSDTKSSKTINLDQRIASDPVSIHHIWFIHWFNPQWNLVEISFSWLKDSFTFDSIWFNSFIFWFHLIQFFHPSILQHLIQFIQPLIPNHPSTINRSSVLTLFQPWLTPKHTDSHHFPLCPLVLTVLIIFFTWVVNVVTDTHLGSQHKSGPTYFIRSWFIHCINPEWNLVEISLSLLKDFIPSSITSPPFIASDPFFQSHLIQSFHLFLDHIWSILFINRFHLIQFFQPIDSIWSNLFILSSITSPPFITSDSIFSSINFTTSDPICSSHLIQSFHPLILQHLNDFWFTLWFPIIHQQSIVHLFFKEMIQYFSAHCIWFVPKRFHLLIRWCTIRNHLIQSIFLIQTWWRNWFDSPSHPL